VQKLVFVFWEGSSGIFYREEDWAYLFQIHSALKASTWAELESMLPEGEFSSLIHWEGNGGETLYRVGDEIRIGEVNEPITDYEGFIIDSTDAFEPGQLDGHDDGDYPPWVQLMFDGLPEPFLEAYGSSVASMLSGSWYEFPMDQADQMTAALRDFGFEVRMLSDINLGDPSP
jgi:hypothetical protein